MSPQKLSLAQRNGILGPQTVICTDLKISKGKCILSHVMTDAEGSLFYRDSKGLLSNLCRVLWVQYACLNEHRLRKLDFGGASIIGICFVTDPPFWCVFPFFLHAVLLVRKLSSLTGLNLKPQFCLMFRSLLLCNWVRWNNEAPNYLPLSFGNRWNRKIKTTLPLNISTV